MSPRGSAEALTAPVSLTTGSDPVYSSTASRMPRAGTAEPVDLDRPGHQFSSPPRRPSLADLDAEPGPEPHEEIGRTGRRVQIRVEVIERGVDRSQHLIESADHAVDEAVGLKHRGKPLEEAVARFEVVDRTAAAHGTATVSWWSTESTSSLG